MALARKDYSNLRKRADALNSRYDNALVVAYSEELDNPDLIKSILEALKLADSSLSSLLLTLTIF